MRIAPVILLIALLMLTGCPHHRAGSGLEKCLKNLEPDIRQAVVVEKAELSPSSVNIYRYLKDNNGWQPVGEQIAGVAGRNGLAPPGEKREGDGRTPSGIFALERGFGYGPLDTKIPYLVLTPEMIWVDEPKSPLYNTLADKKEGEGVSHEIMRRADDLYKYGIVIEYNTRPIVPGAGSAIFFHIWRDGATPTSGCIATAESDMVRILRWLDPAEKPVTVIGEPNGCQ